MKVVVESFEQKYGSLVTKAKVTLQTIDLATQIFKIKDQYERLVQSIEMMESASVHHQRSNASNPRTSLRKRHLQN